MSEWVATGQNPLGEKPVHRLLVLAPTFRDWPSARVLIERLDDEFGRAGFVGHVIVVDDGSPEPTPRAFHDGLDLRHIESVKVVTLTRNLGHQRAIAIGVGYIAHHEAKDFDYMVVMDSDLEDDPRDVAKLVEAAEKNPGKIVFASRTKRHEGIVFKTLYRTYKLLHQLFAGMPLSTGNFSVVPQSLVRRLAGVSEIWSHFAGGAMRARIAIATLPLAKGKREFGQSKMNLVALVIHGLSSLAVHADVVAVRVLIATTLCGALLGAVIAAIIVLRLFTDIIIVGWATPVIIALAILIVQGLLLASLMILLVLAARIQRVLIPIQDHGDFILEVNEVFVRGAGPSAYAPLPGGSTSAAQSR